MYPIGFLFGLGFETTTEVALLGVSASSGAKGMSLANVMVLPVLFTAGKTLVDCRYDVTLREIWVRFCQRRDHDHDEEKRYCLHLVQGPASRRSTEEALRVGA